MHPDRRRGPKNASIAGGHSWPCTTSIPRLSTSSESSRINVRFKLTRDPDSAEGVETTTDPIEGTTSSIYLPPFRIVVSHNPRYLDGQRGTGLVASEPAN